MLEEDPNARPSFFQLIDELETTMAREVSYCGLSKHDESSPHYNVPVEELEKYDRPRDKIKEWVVSFYLHLKFYC